MPSRARCASSALLIYMTPEHLRNPADVDGRADIYALGAIAYMMLTGRKVFDASDDLSMTSLLLDEIPPRVSQYFLCTDYSDGS